MKLSKIKYRDIVFKYTLEEKEKIVFLKNSDKLKDKCDVGIVFGGVSMIPHRVDFALKLYNDRKISKILVTGGIGFLNIDRKRMEALKMKDYLLCKGILESDIIVESRSRSSIENVENSIKLLEKEGYDLTSVKLMLITSDFHVRRCYEMVVKYLGRKDIFVYGVKDGKTDIDNWKKNLYGRITILKETLLLCYYARTGKINDLEIDY